jgi:hypothetical protein
MRQCGCREIGDYLILLEEKPEVADAAGKLLTVPAAFFETSAFGRLSGLPSFLN